MNPYYREQLKEQIQRDVVALREDVAKLEESAKPIPPSNALGRLTRMDGLLDQGLNVAALARKRDRLKLMEDAMENIDDPFFGTCTSCMKDIHIDRLKIMPETQYCSNCAR